MRQIFLVLLGMLVALPAIAQEFRVSPGDVIAVEVLQDPSLNRELLVLPDGSINFPFAGSVQASGRTVNQIQQSLTGAIAPNFAAPPNVFVTVRQTADRPAATPRFTGPARVRTIDIFFMGEVANPGRAELPTDTTLMQALAQSGFTDFAATRRIQLRRTNPHTGAQSVVEFNYRAIENGGTLSHDIPLADGDIILVPERRLFE